MSASSMDLPQAIRTMLRITLGFIFLLHLTALVQSIPIANDNAVAVIWTFPNETWIENIAVRENGQVLCTSINRAAIYQVDPFSHLATTVHQFDKADGILGIAEITNDVFIVVSATINLATSAATPGSAKIWKVDMGAWSLGDPDAITLVGRLPNVELPDGVAVLESDPSVVLVADAAKGVVWRVDTLNGAHSVAIKDPLFKPTKQIPLGVDGIHILDNELYFTNLAINTFAKVAITSNGSATEAAQVISQALTFPDDFGLATDGTSYVGGDNTLWQIKPSGVASVLVGGANSTAVQGITSAQLGRTEADQGVVYMGTNGGMLFTPPGAQVHGGQLLAVNLKALHGM